ncbi:hypothetical protein A3841_16045 [Pontibacter flavimaris]|uniref:Phenylacetate-CoA ligase n=1 Tax=Pontibacter flavimaris TaxID=1797110 RepID=A0A1Q5PE52_9BACT|nr:hypothetical protein A3841_16045 [Pontibacter flavimaris]
MQERIYKSLPNVLQNGLVTFFDYIQYKKRHSGVYGQFLAEYKNAKSLNIEELIFLQKECLIEFLNYAKHSSTYYKNLLNDFPFNQDVFQAYKTIPIQSKEDIRENLGRIFTISKKKAILSKTGGTTGKSMEVRFRPDDMQKRFAILDAWRESFGYKLGDKVAWFSGKSLLTDKDVKANKYWKYDFLYKIRYYSTFHIHDNSIRHYIDDLNNFKPLFAIGFPSSMYEIAKWGLKNNFPLKYKMETLFPTAETIIDEERRVLETFFGGRVVNQYASSEGAPFILECKKGKLHLEMLSGFFEVLDEQGLPAQSGELVFTSFSTHGTPLIRYAIKDRIVLSDEICDCGNHNPVVKSIEGRVNDFIYSKERGKINLGNISNCIKYVKGVIKFQIIQNQEDAVLVLVVKSSEYSLNDEKMFRHELVQRLGEKVDIKFQYVSDIPRESSGKYRIVKNNLKLA